MHSSGAASWDRVDDDLMPEHLGVNYIELSAPAHSEMEVGIVGDEVGDHRHGCIVEVGLGSKKWRSDCIPRFGLWRTTGHRRITSSETLTLVVMPIAPDAGWGAV